jgi:hypothetical protein
MLIGSQNQSKPLERKEKVPTIEILIKIIKENSITT